MYCQCGCGEITPLAKRNRNDLNHVKGEHIPYCRGHNGRPKTEVVEVVTEPNLVQLQRKARITDPIKNQDRVREWRKNNPEKRKMQARRDENTRRARLKEVFVEAVDPIFVYRRDKGICGICGESVAIDNFHVDHIRPISRGGQHSYINVQVAHPLCNVKKGAKYEENNGS